MNYKGVVRVTATTREKDGKEKKGRKVEVRGQDRITKGWSEQEPPREQ